MSLGTGVDNVPSILTQKAEPPWPLPPCSPSLVYKFKWSTPVLDFLRYFFITYFITHYYLISYPPLPKFSPKMRNTDIIREQKSDFLCKMTLLYHTAFPFH